MKLSSLPLFVFSAVSSSSLAASISTGLRGGIVERALQGEVDGIYVMADVQYEQGSDVTGPEEIDSIELSDGQIFELTNTGLPPGLAKKQFQSGSARIKLPAGTTFANGKANLGGRPPHAVGNGKNLFERKLKGERTPEQERNLAEVRRNLAVLGDKTILAVRVVGADSSYSETEAYLRDAWLGTGDDVRNLKSQYAACSHDKLQFDATTDKTKEPGASGTDIVNGVVTVQISDTVTGVADSTIRNAAVNQLAANFDVSSASLLADHVIICVPPGTTGSWIGYAYINSWLSVYNNDWCNYLSIQMHEIGHNIGLAHSGEGATYDDQTGMMGYSYSSDDGPVMCFNNAKLWQLDWFPSAKRTVSAGVNEAVSHIIKGQGILGQEPGVIRINNHYVGFNRKNGYNSGTVEYGNQVTIQTYDGCPEDPEMPCSYGASTLVAILSVGDTYTIGQETIRVDSIDPDAYGGAGAATIEVNGGSSGPVTPEPTNPPTPSPTSAPTTPPTPSPTSAPTSAPTKQPTSEPTMPAPTNSPSLSPTSAPTKQPTLSPTKSPVPPTAPPSKSPSTSPTVGPTKSPSVSPTNGPTASPMTAAPTTSPSASPTKQPTTCTLFKVGESCHNDDDCCSGSCTSGALADRVCLAGAGNNQGPTPTPAPVTPAPVLSPTGPTGPTNECVINVTGSGAKNDRCTANADCASCNCNINPNQSKCVG